MNAPKIMLGSVAAAVVLVGLAFPGLAEASERGTLKNNTKITICYKAGYADARGYVSWQVYKLAPGQMHVWSVQNPQRQPLRLCWDLTLGDGKFVPTGSALPTRPGGFLSAFFRYGNQVWIDTSGGAR